MADREFQIECGQHRGIVNASDEFAAWHQIVGDATGGFAPLARFRESLPPRQGRAHRSGWQPWRYVVPRYFDMRSH